jgi:hypothetical protein
MSNDETDKKMISAGEEADGMEKYPVVDPKATFTVEEIRKLDIAFKAMITKHTPLQDLDRFPEFADIMQGLFERCNKANKRFNPEYHVQKALSGEYSEKKKEEVNRQWTDERDAMISRARLAWCKTNAERWLTNEAAYNKNLCDTRPTESFEDLLATSPLDFKLATASGIDVESSMADRIDEARSLKKPFDIEEAVRDAERINNLVCRQRNEKAAQVLKEMGEAREAQLKFYLKMNIA